ncbi:sugar phosphate isomerase/epimerase family protein [Amaricoccus tamworthensis]|uniref:sugar phosphate isomerase/epimerase family protein n=1 Tax=Amaricoccus tamworthensis TaxID=57002 RepID=UPI003C7ECE0C
MIRTGLCSVTFRELSPVALIDLAAHTGVRVIEWGGDRHVPPGDFELAAQVREMCEARGLAPVSYGSYARAGTPGCVEAFGTVLDTAAKLGAGNIRVWAGEQTRDQAGEAGFAQTAADLGRMARMAADQEITVSVEYHRNTLTEEAEDARDLMRAADDPNLFSYWQPVPGRGRARWLEEMRMLQPWLGDLHVFYWIMTDQGQQRRPMSEGMEDWRALFEAWTPAGHWPHQRSAFLEFVRDDAEKNYRADIQDLHALCGADGA